MTFAASQSTPTASLSSYRTASFNQIQRQLVVFNQRRLRPGPQQADWRDALRQEASFRLLEGDFIEEERRHIRHLATRAPSSGDAFVEWFDALREDGPGQNDDLFPWLAEQATEAQFVWFLSQEVAGEAGFDDLVAMAQVKLTSRAKLEMARNYWDEMGRGNEGGMHGPMLARLADHFSIAPSPDDIVAESHAMANLMTGLAANRRYAFEAIGALGVIELTAPTRAIFVERGLRRLGVPAAARQYFAVHSILDVQHSKAWNHEVLHSLVVEDSRCAQWLAEGALMRLNAGLRCFQCYRKELWRN